MADIFSGTKGNARLVGTVTKKVVYDKLGAIVGALDSIEGEDLESFFISARRVFAMIDLDGIIWINSIPAGTIHGKEIMARKQEAVVGRIESDNLLEIRAGGAALLLGLLTNT